MERMESNLQKTYTQNWKGYFFNIIFNGIFALVYLVVAIIFLSQGVNENAKTIAMGVGGLAVYNMLRIVWIMLVCKNTKYMIDGLFFKDESGVLNKQLGTMDIVKIKDLSMRRSIFDRMFGLSRITISSKDRSDPLFNVFGVTKDEGQEIFDYLNGNATDSYVEYRRRRDG